MDVLIVIFGIAGLLWAVVLLRRGGLLAVCLAELLVAACLGYHFWESSPLTADRILLVALCGLYGVYRLKGWADPKPPDRADYAVLAFLVLLILNTFAHDWRYNNSQPVSDLIFYFVIPMTLYWIARQSSLSPVGIRRFHVVLALFSVYLALTALAEATGAKALIFPRYIVTAKGVDWGWRAQGPFMSPPTNGLYMGVALCAWMMLWPWASRRGRFLVVAAMGLVLLGVCLTLTRACWMGAILGMWGILLLVLPRRRRRVFVTCSVLLAAAAVPIAATKMVAFKRGKNLDAHVTAQSAELRPIIATLEWNVFANEPLFGCGYGNYLEVNKDYVYNTQSDRPLVLGKNYAHHNMFLAILTETGITGMVCYLAMLGLWTRNAFLLWRNRSLPLEYRQQGLLWLGYMANLAMLGLFHNANLDLNIALLTFLLAGVTQGALATSRRLANAPLPAAVQFVAQEPVAHELAVP